MTGKIVLYNKEKGFGFIRIEGKNRDIFFHLVDFNHFVQELEKLVDSEVKFELQETEKRVRAVNIELI